MIDQETTRLLRDLAERYETAAFLEGDPSCWMHRVSGDLNRESMAFVASVLSYGSRSQFMPKIEQIMNAAGGEVDRWIRDGGFEEMFSQTDRTSFYRLYSHQTMALFFGAMRSLLEEYGSLGDYLRKNMESKEALNAVELICRGFAERGVRTVVPKDTASACKRVCMFLRWMVRTDSEVDLGLWSSIIERRSLIMPLDTHVLSEAQRLGLASSGTASMSAARRLTERVREVFPDDPLKADFALFGYGVSRG